MKTANFIRFLSENVFEKSIRADQKIIKYEKPVFANVYKLGRLVNLLKEGFGLNFVDWKIVQGKHLFSLQTGFRSGSQHQS